MHQRSAKAGSCWLRVKLWLKREQTNLADPLPWAKQTLTAVIVASCLWSSSIPLKVLQAGGTAVFWRSVDKWYFWSFWFWSDLRHLIFGRLGDQPPKKLWDYCFAAWKSAGLCMATWYSSARPVTRWRKTEAKVTVARLWSPRSQALDARPMCVTFVISFELLHRFISLHISSSDISLTLNTFSMVWSLVRLYSHQWMLGMLKSCSACPHRWLVGFRLPRSCLSKASSDSTLHLMPTYHILPRIPCERGHQSSTNVAQCHPAIPYFKTFPHPLQTTNRPAK